jgi:hypothetical protein
VRTLSIDPRGPHGLRKTIRSLSSTTRARIKKTAGGAQIDFSDGRSTTFVKEPHMSADSFIAATVQWTRRHGVAAIDIEI